MSLKHDSDYKLRKKKKQLTKRVSSWEEYEAVENFFLQEKAKHEEPTIKGTVRIIAGKAKGVNIQIPKGCRPVTDRMKTQLFDVLRSDIANRTVLDLFAGLYCCRCRSRWRCWRSTSWWACCPAPRRSSIPSRSACRWH